MKNIGKRELILQTLDLQYTGYIPVMPTATAFAISRNGFTPGQCKKDPQKFAEAAVAARQEFDYDALWTTVYQGAVTYMGGGLIDKQSKESVSGESTVHKREDLKKLTPFVAGKCKNLNYLLESIKNMKKLEPDYPIVSVVDNPAMAASQLMDGGNFYYNLIADPDFVLETIAMLEEPIWQAIEAIIQGGADIIWLPMPTIGGTCISRHHYETICRPSNIRLNQKIRAAGAKIILHTCGNWNNRFDLVVEEKAHCLHTAEADLDLLKAQYGDKIVLMGQMPAVFSMLMETPDEVYAKALATCLKMKQGGGFILSADCGLPPATPAANLQALIRAARDAQSSS